jgi:WD40 repeat protein/serine/threonine protein kinase
MGVVYKARQISLNRVVALKMILAGSHASPGAMARFLQEAAIIARLKHPHVVQVYDYGSHEGKPYFSLEYLEGGSLAERLQGEPQPVAQAAHLEETLAQAVQAAHQQGIIHRDLKPANVLLAADGTPKISDFGLAKQGESGVTASGEVLGTPSYMAPEQAQTGAKTVGPAADVYALGAILYELLTGRPPFKAGSVWDTVQMVMTTDPVAPSRLQPKVPRDLETICLKCLQKDPGKRYGSSAVLGDDLRRFLDGRPILARQVRSGEKLWRWCRRNPAVASLITAVAVLLLAGTGISAYFAVQAVQEKTHADERAEDYRKQLYVSNVNRALGEWQNNNVSLAERLLDGCPEDLRGWEWRYARRLCYQERLTIHGCFALPMTWYGAEAHYTVAFSPDSQWVATMDWDHTMKLWDTATGTRVRAMQGDTGLVYSLAFSPDGKWLASGNTDHTVRIWNTETGELVHTLRGHHFIVYLVHFCTDGKRLLSASPALVDNHEWLSQMEIITWDPSSGRELSRKVVADANIRWGGVAFSPDGSQFVASGNNEAQDVGPRVVGYLGSALGQGPFLAAATLRPGRPGDAPTMKLGNTDTGQCVHASYSDFVWASAFRPDGKMVATAGWKTIWLWDAATGKQIRSLQGHTDNVSRLAFNADGTRLASGGMDRTVRLWETATGKEVACFRGETSFIQSLAFSPNGQWVASVGGDGVLRLWDVVHGAPPLTLRGTDGMWPSNVIFSPDAQLLYSFCGHSGSGTPAGIDVWDWRSDKQRATLPGSEGRFRALAMSPDGKRLATSDKDGHITLWDAPSGRRLDRWAAATGPIHSLAFSPDGKALAYTSSNQVIVIDPESRQQISTFLGSGNALYSLTFSPDNGRLAAAAQDQVMVWERASGQVLFSFAADTFDERTYHLDPLVAFSSDGKLAAADKNRISIRDGRTGRELLSLPGHSGRVVCLAFSPDGRRLATGCESDRIAKFWDTTTGQETLSLRMTEGPPSIAFSPDGNRLASSHMDATLRIWDATPASPDRVDQRLAHEWIQANFSDISGVEDALRDPEGLREPARTLAVRLAQQRVQELGRIPAYYQRLGNELWAKGWNTLAQDLFTFAEKGFRKNVALNPSKARARGDFAFFLVACPDHQFRDATKAITHAQKALSLAPPNADFAALAGMAQYRSGEWQAAVGTLGKAISRGPARYRGPAKIFLSMAHHQLGHAMEAQRWYQQALTEMKEDGSGEALGHLLVEAAVVHRVVEQPPANGKETR